MKRKKGKQDMRTLKNETVFEAALSAAVSDFAKETGSMPVTENNSAGNQQEGIIVSSISKNDIPNGKKGRSFKIKD